MLLFLLWAVVFIGVLVAAGYSHYRYRVRHNQYYARLFAKTSGEHVDGEIKQGKDASYSVLLLLIAAGFLLVPLSLVL